MSGWCRIEIASDADVAGARHAARAALVDEHGDLVYAAELVISELVTNALLHGGGAASATISVEAGVVRIEVADRSRHAPLVAVSSPDAMTGRGLGLVSRLAANWGVDALDDGTGKVVWAELDTTVLSLDTSSADELLAAWSDPFENAATGSRTRVSLGQVPTELLLAAKRHVDNLIREFELTAGGGRSGTTTPIPQTLTDLLQRVVTEFQEARLEIKRQATAAARTGASHAFLELDVAIDSADAAEAYLSALDEIDSYSRANRLLTLETPPQHRVFRQWYVGEIVKQLRAASSGATPPPVVAFEQRLLAEVDVAEMSRRRAERAARLYTVAVALSSAVTAEEVAAAVLGEGVAALGATGGGVLLATDAEHLAVPGTVGYDEATVEKLRLESRDAELPAAYALRNGEPVWLETIEERDARFPALVGLEPDTVAMCAVPVSAGGDVVGALRFSFGDRRLFDDDEQRFVLALAAETSEALHRARLLDSERRMRSRIERLAQVGGAMLRGGDLDTILQLATDAATEVSGAEFGAFFYRAPGGREGFELFTVSGLPRSAFEQLPMPRNTLIFNPTFTGTAVVRLDDVTADPRFARNPPHQGLPDGHPPVRSYLAVPVTLSTGEVVGAMFFGHREPRRFNDEAERLTLGVAGQAAGTIENARSLAERTRVATLLQQSLLPAALPDVDGADLGAVYSAAGAAAGGDFYDIFPIGASWGVAIGDVRGRGPEAAALTSLARYTIRTAAKLGRTPGQVLEVLNTAFHTDDDPERFCSALFAIVELGAARRGAASVTYASAGHPPGAVVREGTIEQLPPTGGLIGIEPSSTFDERTVGLSAGDAMVLFTDGISESRSGTLQFGEAGLVSTLAAVRGRPARTIAEALLEAARAFSGSDAADATDDAAVFVLSVR